MSAMRLYSLYRSSWSTTGKYHSSLIKEYTMDYSLHFLYGNKAKSAFDFSLGSGWKRGCLEVLSSHPSLIQEQTINNSFCYFVRSFGADRWSAWGGGVPLWMCPLTNLPGRGQKTNMIFYSGQTKLVFARTVTECYIANFRLLQRRWAGFVEIPAQAIFSACGMGTLGFNPPFLDFCLCTLDSYRTLIEHFCFLF